MKKITDAKKVLAAVKQNGNALYYVKKQTPAICLAAVKQNGNALRCANPELRDEVVLRLTEQGYTAELDEEFHIMAMWKLSRVKGNV